MVKDKTNIISVKISNTSIIFSDDPEGSWDLFIARSDRRVDVLHCYESSASWSPTAHRLYASASKTSSTSSGAPKKVVSTAACYVEPSQAFWLGDAAGRLHAYE